MRRRGQWGFCGSVKQVAIDAIDGLNFGSEVVWVFAKLLWPWNSWRVAQNCRASN